MVSRRPPFFVSTSFSKDRRWVSMRGGPSRTFSRREKLRRVRAASARAKAATPSDQGFGGDDGGAQSATRQYSKRISAPSRGGCRPPARWRGGWRGHHGPHPEAPDMCRSATEGRLRL